MYKEVLRTMDTQAFYAALALAVFFAYFVFMVLDTMRKKKADMNHMGNLPLEDGAMS